MSNWNFNRIRAPSSSPSSVLHLEFQYCTVALLHSCTAELLHCRRSRSRIRHCNQLFLSIWLPPQKTQAAFHNQMFPQLPQLLRRRDVNIDGSCWNCCCCTRLCKWHHQRSLAAHVAATNVCLALHCDKKEGLHLAYRGLILWMLMVEVVIDCKLCICTYSMFIVGIIQFR